ncbi:hypothetical protein BDF22DRAFT_668503 [Syncephalis plumigaleata]|nr:hypothetical protein BDF22DRAFT_668503 [Syncephalis plumigaleata]
MIICHLIFKSIELLPTTYQSALTTLSDTIKSSSVLREHCSTIETITESCPSIPFTDLLVGTCAYGHQWNRCTVTLQVPQSHHTLRTCVNCQVKTIAPSWLASSNTTTNTTTSSDDRSSHLFINHLLQQLAPVCNYCGCSFYNVLGNQ